MMKNELKIVPISEIPIAEQTPIENLMGVYSIYLKLEELCKKEKGVGISAVQAGIPWNLFLSKNENGFDCFLNCDYTPSGETKVNSLEGCLSIKDSRNQLRYFDVPRWKEIILNGSKLVRNSNDLVLEPVKDVLITGFRAIVIQHEIDHAKNVLISDIGVETQIYSMQED